MSKRSFSTFSPATLGKRSRGSEEDDLNNSNVEYRRIRKIVKLNIIKNGMSVQESIRQVKANSPPQIQMQMQQQQQQSTVEENMIVNDNENKLTNNDNNDDEGKEQQEAVDLDSLVNADSQPVKDMITPRRGGEEKDGSDEVDEGKKE